VAIIKNNLILPNISFQQVYGVLRSSKYNCTLTKGTPSFVKQIKGKVFNLCQGASGNNYFHFIFDIIPKIYLLKSRINLNQIDYFYVSDPKIWQIKILKSLGININKLLNSKNIVFAIGPAGTGKTYIAVAKAVSALQNGKVNKIILSRPAVEAGEKLGFLPGDLKEKVDPFLRPIYDALYSMLPFEQVEKKIANNIIEIAPIAFMRGRTLEDCFIILDEAQNATRTQMKMFLTRLGRNSQMVVVGDITQIDLVSEKDSGLKDALKKLIKIEDIGFVQLNEKDVVRHELVKKIINAYEKNIKN